MTRSGQALRVPSAVRDIFDEVVARTDTFCLRHLDEEYADLSAALAAKLARKRPSPLARGDRDIWAAGVVYAIGRVNFLADPNQTPHLRTEELARLLGVKQTTMANKGRLIMDTLNIGLMDPEFSRHDLLERNPMAWLLQMDGLLVDARDLPEAFQVELCRRGLIPYVPRPGERRPGRPRPPVVVSVCATSGVRLANQAMRRRAGRLAAVPGACPAA